MFNKIKKNALSSSKSSNKTVKNKAAAFKDSALVKDFSAAHKADDYENSFSSNDEQLQSLIRSLVKVSHKSPAKRVKTEDQKY